MLPQIVAFSLVWWYAITGKNGTCCEEKPMTDRIEQENAMVSGTIWKQLLCFFLPILLGTFFQQMYNTADALIVGRSLGENALAAVGGSTGMITSTAVGFFMGLTSGAAIIASQMLGAKNREKVNSSIHTIYAFALIAGAAVSILGVIGAQQMLIWMKTPDVLLQDSKNYLQIYFSGLIFVLVYNTGASLLRALGDAKTPFCFLILCCMLNVVLDFIFIVYFQMGVGGAAWATVIAQGISAVLVTVRLLRFREVCDFHLRHIRVDRTMLLRELQLGLPGGTQAAMYSISNILVTAAVNAFGEVTVASWTAYTKLDGLFWMISGAMGVTITTFVGQNYGAGKINRIKRSVGIMNWAYVGISITASLLAILLRIPLFRIFVQSEEAVAVGCRMLLVISPFYIFNIFIENYAGALRGVGDTFAPMLFSVFGICVFRLIYLWVLFPLRPTLEVLCAMYPITWLLTNTLYLIYYPYRIKRLVTR